MAQPASSVTGALALFTAISAVDLASNAYTAVKATSWGRTVVSYLGISNVTEEEAAEARDNLVPVTIFTVTLAASSVLFALRR